MLPADTMTSMSLEFKVDADSVCRSCKKVSQDGDCIQCFKCKEVFHIQCDNVGDKKIATVTMIKLYHTPATKANIKAFCDECLTVLEKGEASSDTQRINLLEAELRTMSKKLEKLDDVQDQLLELKQLLQKAHTKEVTNEPVPASLWNDKERVKRLKAQTSVLGCGPTASSML